MLVSHLPPASRWVVSEDDAAGTTVTVLYTDEVHRLTGPVAALWRLCDGRTSLSQALATTGLTEQQALDALLTLESLGILRKPLRARWARPTIPAPRREPAAG